MCHCISSILVIFSEFLFLLSTRTYKFCNNHSCHFVPFPVIQTKWIIRCRKTTLTDVEIPPHYLFVYFSTFGVFTSLIFL